MIAELLRLLQIGADFNALDAEGRVRTSLRFTWTPEIPSVGEWVLLTDAEGNNCRACVEEIEGLSLLARPDWTTWIPGQIAQLSQSFVGAVGQDVIGVKPLTEGTAPRVTGHLQAAV